MSAEISAITYRDVPGHVGYRVGSDGSVWSRLNNKWGLGTRWKKLKPTRPKCGYPAVSLKGRGKVRVHCLVLEVFIGPCPDGMEGCHRDDIKTNNALSNLRWDTRHGNQSDRDKNGTSNKGERNGQSRLTEADVMRIRSLYAAGGVTQNHLARLFGVHFNTINFIVRGITWKHLRFDRTAIEPVTHGEGNR